MFLSNTNNVHDFKNVFTATIITRSFRQIKNSFDRKCIMQYSNFEITNSNLSKLSQTGELIFNTCV